jgi:hypothetical protein
MIRPVLFVSSFGLAACGGTLQGSNFAYAGPWTGYVAGHASFSETWQDEAYCSGPFVLTVDDDGAATGSGSCTILWGPALDAVMDVTASGSVAEDGAATIDVMFEDADELRDFDDAACTGTAGDKLEVRGESYYVSTFGGGSEQEAFVRLILAPGNTANTADDPSAWVEQDGGGR